VTDDESGESIEYLVLDSDAVLLIFLLSTHRLQVDKCLLQPHQTPNFYTMYSTYTRWHRKRTITCVTPGDSQHIST